MITMKRLNTDQLLCISEHKDMHISSIQITTAHDGTNKNKIYFHTYQSHWM